MTLQVTAPSARPRSTAVCKKAGKLSGWWAAAGGKLPEKKLAKLPEGHWKPKRPAEFLFWVRQVPGATQHR